jgi:hypothetical protein
MSGTASIGNRTSDQTPSGTASAVNNTTSHRLRTEKAIRFLIIDGNGRSKAQ